MHGPSSSAFGVCVPAESAGMSKKDRTISVMYTVHLAPSHAGIKHLNNCE